MNLKELFVLLSQKAGVESQATDLISSVENVEVDLNEELVNAFSGLLSMEAAKNSDDLKNHFSNKLKPQLLDPIDEKIKKIAEKLPQEQKDALMRKHGSYEKLDFLTQSFPETTSKGKNDEVIASLRKQLEQAAEVTDTKVSEIKAQLDEANNAKKSLMLNMGLNYQINQNKYASLSNDDVYTLVNAKLSSKADSLGAEIAVDEIKNGIPKLKLVKKGDPEGKVFDSNNKEVSFQSVFENLTSEYIQKTPEQTSPEVKPIGGQINEIKKVSFQSNVMDSIGKAAQALNS